MEDLARWWPVGLANVVRILKFNHGVFVEYSRPRIWIVGLGKTAGGEQGLDWVADKLEKVNEFIQTTFVPVTPCAVVDPDDIYEVSRRRQIEDHPAFLLFYLLFRFPFLDPLTFACPLLAPVSPSPPAFAGPLVDHLVTTSPPSRFSCSRVAALLRPLLNLRLQRGFGAAHRGTGAAGAPHKSQVHK